MPRKKKQQLSPRRKRMTRQGRLESAKTTSWVEKYEGKNLIKGYAKWFAVDLLCAVAELRMLGVEISRERENQLRGTIEARAADRDKESDMLEEYDFSSGVRDKYVERFDVPSDEENLRLWVAEAERRLGDFRSGKVKGIPADEVFRRARTAISEPNR